MRELSEASRRLKDDCDHAVNLEKYVLPSGVAGWVFGFGIGIFDPKSRGFGIGFGIDPKRKKKIIIIFFLVVSID